MSELCERECVPCRGGVPALDAEAAGRLMTELNSDWRIVWRDERPHHLSQVRSFDRYVDGVAFVNRLAEIAEANGHHPDLYLAWGKVRIELWTHKIDGLTESDFVMAAKFDQISSTH